MYQKTNAVSEIKRVGKDSFWAKAEVSVAQGVRMRAGIWSGPVCTSQEMVYLLCLSFSYNKLIEQMSLVAPTCRWLN